MPNKTLDKLSLIQDIRASKDEGIIEGYVAVWNTTDSYNSRFQRGSFKKTLENRMHKIKVLWNHDQEQPIGKLTEIREDDHGLFIRAQLIMEVDKAKETLALIKGEAIDCFSFGFRTVKDKFENGVQVITEVMLGEISPVVFEANPASKITAARSTDFNETVEQNALRARGFKLMDALYEALDDIWWESSDDDIVDRVNKAVGAFGSSYSSWAQEIMDMRGNNTRMDIHSGNELSTAFRNFCKNEDKSIDLIAQTTAFTTEELKSLRTGSNIADFNKLKTLNQEIFDAHANLRSKAVETLFSELRNGINTAEATRIKALLSKSLEQEVPEQVDPFEAYRKNLLHKLNKED